MISEASKRRAFSLTELLAAIVIMAVLGILIFAALREVIDRANRMSCAANLRELGSVALIWSSENNGDLLPVVQYSTHVGGSGATWISILESEGYLPKVDWVDQADSIMCCPSRDNYPQLFGPRLHYGINMFPGFTNTASSYSHNPSASRPFRKVYEVERPAKTFLFGEVQNNYWLNTDGTRAANIYPHDGGQNLVFFDGHTEYFQGELTLQEDAVDTYPFY